MRIIIFTDLDGSLLNHADYSYSEAMPSIHRIKHCGIPLIFTTSKTRLEVEHLQREMGIADPFIVENGGGIFFPSNDQCVSAGIGESSELKNGYTVMTTGIKYQIIRKFIVSVHSRFSIRGFGDMSSEEIAKLTGLPIEKAAHAKEREFTEPFIMERPDEIDQLAALAADAGLKVVRGGRFHHLIGSEQDKGKAVAIVSDIFRQNIDEEIETIGIGDSENDLAMLESVDVPVLIPRPRKGHLDIRLPGLILAGECGAKGWNDVVQKLLDEMKGRLHEGITARKEEIK